MRSPAAVGHLDADCFYVSAERVRDHFLRGKAVGVLGNQGACVIAKSYEMKHAGVKTGMPVWDAIRLCPQGVYVKRDFRWYELLSRQMLEVVRAFSPRVEYYSIDEFFFEVPSGVNLQETAERMRDAVLRQVGVPATVGIARTKTLAKLVSDTAKPFGALALLDADAERVLMEQLPVTEVSGIAERRAARLAPHGITTCLDLALADRRLVRWLLTVTGEALWYELNGDPVLPFYTERPPHKMLSRGGSLGGPTEQPERVYAWLVRNLERLVEELEFHVVKAGALSVYIMHKDGSDGCARMLLPSHTDRFDLLLEAARPALKKAWRPERPATRMHVTASQLRRPGAVQLGLFDPPVERACAVAKLKREINAEVRRFALRSGATLPLADVYRDEAQGYDICDVRGKICF
ncbi:MAG TPA: nucleotidyltransferase [Gemmataceae bacterium]|jgi:nucleotidyltransferase/DNA polymerase involved in DNA repair